MAATFVNNLRVAEPADGDADWGTTTNTSLELIGEALGIGSEAIVTNADTHTSTVADGATDPARALHLQYTGTLDSACTITIAPNTLKRVQIIENATSGGQSIIIKQGSGATITILNGTKRIVYLDGAGSGAAVVDITAAAFGAQAFYVPSGTTGNRPTGVAGAFRYNTTTGAFEGYTDQWGDIGGSGATDISTNEFSGNGSTTAFTLSADPSTENNTQVYIDGVYQEKGTYAVSGTTLTFSTAPPNGTSIEVMAFTASSIGVPTDDTVSTAKIVNDAVTQAKIADDAVGADQLASSAVVTASIVDDAVTQAKIADDAVGADQLASSAVVTASIVDDNVTQAKIADDAVGADQLASSAVVTASMVDDAVTTAKIADDAITSALIADDAVGSAAIADNSVDIARLNVSDGSANQVLTTDGGNTLSFQTGKLAGKETIYVPAAAMYPNSTNGCSDLQQVELANGPELKCLDFDASSDENAQFTVCFPKSWNEGTVTFQAFFTVSGTNTGTVAWGLSGGSTVDNGSINTAFGTNVVATAKAHSGTSNDMDVAAESGAVTIANAAADSMTFFQIMRDVSADTQSGDARLLGIKLFFTTDAANDS